MSEDIQRIKRVIAASNTEKIYIQNCDVTIKLVAADEAGATLYIDAPNYARIETSTEITARKDRMMQQIMEEINVPCSGWI